MDISAIASASIDMSLAKVQQGVEVAVAKKAMNFQEQQATALLEQMTPPASFGHALDVYA